MADPIDAMPPTHAEMQAEREAGHRAAVHHAHYTGATPRQVALVNDALKHIVGGAELCVPEPERKPVAWRITHTLKSGAQRMEFTTEESDLEHYRDYRTVTAITPLYE